MHIKKISFLDLVNRCFIVCFFLIICIGLFSLFRTPKNFSHFENRNLNKLEFPTIKSFMSKSFQDKTENALADQILYSQTIKKNGTKFLKFFNSYAINPKICKKKNVYIAKDYITYDCGFQIMNAPIQKYNEDALSKSIKFFNGINSYTDTYYYVLDRAYAWDFSKNKLLLDSYDYLKNNLIGDYHIARLKVDSYEDYLNYFYNTDHHWNRIGSYQGYKDIVKLLGAKGDVLEPIDEVTLNNKFYGSTAKKSKDITKYDDFTYYNFNIKEHLVYINGLKGEYGNYKFNNNIDYVNYYTYIYGGDYGEIIFDFDNSKRDNLLIIGTSYTNPINRLVASHYNKTYILDPRYYKNYDGSNANIKEYIDDHDIDKVLILTSTDVLNGTIVSLEWEG